MSCPAVELGLLGNRNQAATEATIVEGTDVPGRTNTRPETLPEFSLPPTDTGKDAWLFLAACWAVEALVWGMYLSSYCFLEFLLRANVELHY
jgi:hypothetical protein